MSDNRRYKQAAAFGERASRQLLIEAMIRERIAFAYRGTGVSLLMTA
jgi:hypothetical protein